MTLSQKINQLIILREAASNRWQQEALKDAVLMMRSTSDYYELAYLRGYRDAKRKGDEA